MTQEEKQLLLKDLCARLPYKTFVDVIFNTDNVNRVELNAQYIFDWMTVSSCKNVVIKPYLRPMSSMTEEEKYEFENLLEGIVDGVERWDKPDLCEEYDWLNAHHFDYRGLIPMGLALEAEEGMYKID